MTDAHSFLETLALVFCVAAVTTVVFQRLRQPVVFGYLLAGMIVGPYLPIPLTADASTVRTLSELGVILLMFSLGLEFRLRRVVQVAGTSGLAALAETSAMMGIGFVVGQALGWSTIESIFAGAMIAISSTTIIAKAFSELGVRGRVTEIVFGVLIVEDMIAILLIAILTALAQVGSVSIGTIGQTSLRLAAFLAGLVAVGLLLVPRLMRAIVRAGRPETTLVASIGVCFGAAMLALTFGYSVALGAFIAGSLVAESGESSTIERLVHPVRDIFVAIFFVAVGMMIDPSVLAVHWRDVLALALVVIAGKVVSVTVAAFLTGNGLRLSVQAGMSLAQIGEFSLIIAAVGTAAGAIRPFMYPVAIAVSALTTLTTPWLIRLSGPVALIVDRRLPKPMQTFVALYGSWIERLRGAQKSGGQRALRRLIRLVILDAVLLILVIVGAAVEMTRIVAFLSGRTGFSDESASVAVIGAAALLSLPLLFGLVRTTRRLGLSLAVRALPASEGARVDFAQAPRTVLARALQIAILLSVATPLLAITQPFLRGATGYLLTVAAVGVLVIAFWRSARDLQGHARAGAQAIVAALGQQMARDRSPEGLSHTLEHMSVLLPGLGEPEPLVLADASPAVGHTLAELNIRGLTGATVLCISRAGEIDAPTLVPTGRERLRPGDVLAIAGSRPAIDAARSLFAPPTPGGNAGDGASQLQSPSAPTEPEDVQLQP